MKLTSVTGLESRTTWPSSCSARAMTGGAGEAWALTGQDVPVITPAGVSLAWGEYDITSDAYAYTYARRADGSTS